MSDIRGIDPQGHPRDVSVTNDGDVNTALRAFSSGRIVIPGVTTTTYAAADAFGDKFNIAVPVYGTIVSLTFLDRDDEGLTKEFVLFSLDFTATADNAAFNPSDSDLLNCVGVISVDTFYNYSGNQVGVVTPALTYVAPSGRLYVQVVTRGADAIAAGSEPMFTMVIV